MTDPVHGDVDMAVSQERPMRLATAHTIRRCEVWPMTERPSRRTVVMSTLLGGATVAFPLEGAGREAAPANPSAESRVRPLPTDGKVTVERRGIVLLIGINRPDRHNRVDPETFRGLARAYSAFDGDPILMPAPATLLFVLLCGLAYARRRDLLPSEGQRGT